MNTEVDHMDIVKEGYLWKRGIYLFLNFVLKIYLKYSEFITC